MRRGVTLIELIIAMGILVVLAAISMSAMSNLNEQSRIARTKTIIRKIDAVIMEKWEGYRTRPTQLSRPILDVWGKTNGARIRLNALRETQRMELPERATDIDPRIGPAAANPVGPVNLALGLQYRDPTNPTVFLPVPPVYLRALPTAFKRYQRIVSNAPMTWADTYAQSECLYLILSGIRDDNGSALDMLSASEVGDLDGDGLKEVLDGWGQPIWFLRWAPGFSKELPYNQSYPPGAGPYPVGIPRALTLQSCELALDLSTGTPAVDPLTGFTIAVVPDPFDFSRAESRAFAVRPLIISAGPDKLMDIYLEYNRQNDRNKDIRYADPTPGNPYYPLALYFDPGSTPREGEPFDMNGDGSRNWVDNITNHYLETP
jgi:prepilin-type N-terminal cleavage/methylation domain-containing protein